MPFIRSNHSLMRPFHCYLLVVVLSSMACACRVKSPNNLPIPRPGRAGSFDWQGHRGARGLMPENSIPGFLKALSFPQIKTLEMDLAITRDSQVVVSHDPEILPEFCQDSTGGNLPAAKLYQIFQLSYATLQKFTCGKMGHPRFPEQTAVATTIPRLAEVVQAVEQYCQTSDRPQPFYNLEIKSMPEWDGQKTPTPATFAALVWSAVQQLGIQDRVIIQSFDVRALQAMHQLAPDCPLALLVENTLGMSVNLQRLGFIPEIYSPYHVLVSANVVKKAHRLGMRIIPWTVNEREKMLMLQELGVDGIITDYPNRIPVLAE